MRRFAFALATCVLLAALAACSQSQSSSPSQGSGTGDWLFPGHDLSFNRSVSASFDRQNVAQLRPAWTTAIADIGEQEAAPIVAGGTMYVATPHNSVLALDASTGKLLWDAAYTPSEVLDFAVDRGVGFANGKVFIATQDCRMRALDATSGKELWNVNGCSLQANNWYSMAVYPYKNMVLVGVAGGDFGGNGALQAFDQATGTKLWQWNTIPGPGEPKHETWPGDSWKHGGAALWGGLSVDTATGIVYVAPGNPAPDFQNENRMGDNLYSDSVVALDVNGDKPAIKWYYQITNRDMHDADPAMPPVLFDGTVGGQSRHLLAIGDKGGNFVILDRTTGAVVHRLAVAHQLGLDSAPTPQGAKACPNHGGGVEWNGGAYDASTNLFIVPVTQECGVFFQYPTVHPWIQGQNYHGGPMAKRQDGTGQVQAVDVATGKIAWTTPLPYPAQGGALVTTEGLTFTSDLAGNLYALDTKTGKTLWTYATHTAIVAPFSIYQANGQTYLAVLGGEPGNQKTPNVPQSKGDYVMAFMVGALHAIANDTTGQTAPSNISAAGVVQSGTAPYTDAQVQAGKAAYAQSCAQCHGAQLQGVSAPALSGAAFGKSNLSVGSMRTIVTKQMPLTAPGSLSAAQYAAIVAYLLASNCVKPLAPAEPFPTGTPAPNYANIVLVGMACSVEQKTE